MQSATEPVTVCVIILRQDLKRIEKRRVKGDVFHHQKYEKRCRQNLARETEIE